MAGDTARHLGVTNLQELRVLLRVVVARRRAELRVQRSRALAVDAVERPAGDLEAHAELALLVLDQRDQGGVWPRDSMAGS